MYEHADERWTSTHPAQQTFAPAHGRELSLGQEALWFLQQLAPDSGAYNVAAALNLHFAADPAVMASAVQRLVSGHTVLNCVFRSVSGEVRRYPCDTAEMGSLLEVEELSSGDQAAREFAAKLARRPFELDRRPPVRITLLRRKGSPDILLVAAHHIAVDNISLSLLVREILAAYAALTAGVEYASADTGADFDEFVIEQRRFLESPRAISAQRYWRGVLESVPRSDGLPTDHRRPAVYRFAGSEIEFALPQELVARVESAASALNVTVFAYLFSVFQLLLYTFGRHSDFVVGYNVTLRSGRRFRESIGFFVNTLLFNARIDPDGSFGTLLRRTSEELWRGLRHRDYPFALMPRLIDVERDPGQAGLLSVMFVMIGADRADPSIPAPGQLVEYSGLTVSDFYLPQQQGQFDLTFQLSRRGPDMTATLKYNTSLFTADTARHLTREFTALLTAAADGGLPPRLGNIRGRNADNHDEQPEMRI
jgi:Condensation domain